MEILQLVTAKFITKCEGQADIPFLQSVTRLITNCDKYYNYKSAARALQSVMYLLKITTGRIKCDDYHKLRHYTTVHPADENRAEKLQR